MGWERDLVLGSEGAERVFYPTPDTLYPTPDTLHPTPYTLHPTPYTLHPTPYTQHPTPYTIHFSRESCCTSTAAPHQLPPEHQTQLCDLRQRRPRPRQEIAFYEIAF